MTPTNEPRAAPSASEEDKARARDLLWAIDWRADDGAWVAAQAKVADEFARIRAEEREAAFNEAIVIAAAKCDSFREFIAQTSHREGLGMGDRRSEDLLQEMATRIRAIRARGPERADPKEE
jgi:hypothetical protein